MALFYRQEISVKNCDSLKMAPSVSHVHESLRSCGWGGALLEQCTVSSDDGERLTCTEDALAICTSAPVQHRAARKVPAQPQQPGASKQLLLIS